MNLRCPNLARNVGIASIAFIAYCGVQGALLAQVTPAKSAAAAPPNPVPVPVPAKSGRIAQITADRWDDKKSAVGTIYSLLGHAKIVSDETTVLTTDNAYYNDKSSVATAPGRLEINDPQNTIIGDAGIAYYTKRDAKINGNVHITMRPKPEMKNAPEGSARREFKNPVYITCDHVDYDWKTRIAVATGNLVMKTEDRTVTAEKATYYGSQETVVLTGKVHYSRPNNDYGDTEEATAILTEGNERFYTTGSGHGSITIDKEEENGTQSGASPIPPPPTTNPVTSPPTGPSTPPGSPTAPPNAPSQTPPVSPAGGNSPGVTPPPPAAPPAANPPATSPPATGSTPLGKS